MKYITLFTIGPVQSFIAKARKLQDLYAGSFLLSYLSKRTMFRARELGATILFPNPEQQSAPNRFLMTVEKSDTAELRKFCGKLKGYVLAEWINIAKKVLAETCLKYTPAVSKQIVSMIQVYYASEKYSGGEQFSECYINVIKRLGAAKTLRSFRQLDEPYGRKCNLMHEHNALFYREWRNYLVVDAQKVTESNVRDLDKYIQVGETLSAPAFVKRCLNFAKIDGFDAEFSSISNVACAYQLGELVNEDSEMASIINKVLLDPTPLMTQNYDDIETSDKLATKADYEKVRHMVHKFGLSPYYAVIMFDGDDMGKWYSEPDKKGVNRGEIEKFQAFLSEKISEFAAERSRKIVDWKMKKNGAVIYAGGEDFLGAMNIRSVFSALYELRETFGKIDLLAYTPKKLSFSAGVVIAHVKTPLSAVLDLAREAEHKAKARIGKDAFCLTIAKHSGEVTEFVLPFYHGEMSGLATLDRLVQIIVKEDLSVKFIYQLGEELERIAETDNTAFHKEIFLTEAERILKHSVFENKDKRDMIVKEVVGILAELVKDAEFDLKNLLMYLRAIAFIARERGAV